LADVASVRRGITTGANEFFYLSRAGIRTRTKRRHRRVNRLNQRVHGRARWFGKLQEIESELLSSVVFSLKEIPGILLERVAARRMLFNCSLTPNDLAGTRALEYIESGERGGYHRRPTCSSREPWYSVARGMKPAPLIFPSKVGERWVVALNRARSSKTKNSTGVPVTRSLGIGACGASKLDVGALLRRSDLPPDDRRASDSRHRRISSRTNTVARSSHLVARNQEET